MDEPRRPAATPIPVAWWRDPHAKPATLSAPRPVTLAMGVFDGVHRGHATLLRRVVDDARTIGGGLPTVLTFDPNPARLMRPTRYMGDLSTVEGRIAEFARHGIEAAVVVAFQAAFSAMPGALFLDRILDLFPDLRMVVVGDDFRLGHGRDVDVHRLAEILTPRGVRVDTVEALKDNDVSISSSRIRQAVVAGDLEHAAVLLGRPYTVTVDGRLPNHRNECAQLLPSTGGSIATRLERRCGVRLRYRCATTVRSCGNRTTTIYTM